MNNADDAIPRDESLYACRGTACHAAGWHGTFDRSVTEAARGVYAARFNARAIRRPRPLVAQMTDEQFAAHLTSLPSQFARDIASMVRNFGRAFPTR